MLDQTPLEVAMADVIAKTETVAAAKQAVGTTRAEADRERKAKIASANARLNEAKAALDEAQKRFDREVRAASKP